VRPGVIPYGAGGGLFTGELRPPLDIAADLEEGRRGVDGVEQAQQRGRVWARSVVDRDRDDSMRARTAVDREAEAGVAARGSQA
jgi:hypothetical protein